MEKMNIIFFLIIIIYLIYSYIKTRELKKEDKKKDCFIESDYETEDYEKHLIAASIAAVMDKKYNIKRIFLHSTGDEKNSLWKISGRQERMMRKM